MFYCFKLNVDYVVIRKYVFENEIEKINNVIHELYYFKIM